MYRLKKTFNICCAHVLSNEDCNKETNKKLFGRCNVFHGHNYRITLYLKQSKLNKVTGMIENFTRIKEVFRDRIDNVYDHNVLNSCPGFTHRIPTAENMAYVFYKRLKTKLKTLYAVEIEETDGASAIYEN